jgi:hypothetical protein
MPWTIPNLVLHDKPVARANTRSHGRNRVFIYCNNPDCHRNAELDVNRLSDDVIFGDLQPRVLHRVRSTRRRRQPVLAAAPWLIVPAVSRTRSPSPMAERDQRLEMPTTRSQACRRLSSISVWQTSIRSLMGAADGQDFVMHSRIGVLHALNRNVKGLFNSGHKTHWGNLRR